MDITKLGDRIQEGDWLHTGDVLVSTNMRPGKPLRRVTIEKIVYHQDLTRSFVLAPTDAYNSRLYRTLTSEKTLRQDYRRVSTNEVREDNGHQGS